MILAWILHDACCSPAWPLWSESTRLGVPVLGTVHGKMVPARSIELLLRVLREVDSGPLAQLWVLTPRSQLDQVAAQFARGDWQQPMPSGEGVSRM